MSELTDAFEEMLDAAEAAKGIREVVGFRGEQLDALIFEEAVDIIPGGGGMVDGASIKVSLRKADVVLPIENLEPIEIRGRDLKVQQYFPLEGRIDVVAYDPAVEND